MAPLKIEIEIGYGLKILTKLTVDSRLDMRQSAVKDTWKRKYVPAGQCMTVL